MSERILKSFICLSMIPVVWAIMALFAIVIIGMPIVALIKPECVKWHGR